MNACSLLIVACLALSSAALLAQDSQAAPPTTQPATTQPAKAVNTVCPISGEPIDPAVTLTHDGKVVAFCCEGCIRSFKRDPEKYMKNLK